MKSKLIGIFLFALPPALVVGGIAFLASGNWVLSSIVGGAMWGFGLDVLFGKGCQ